jgi:hypothetical protein
LMLNFAEGPDSSVSEFPMRIDGKQCFTAVRVARHS